MTSPDTTADALTSAVSPDPSLSASAGRNPGAVMRRLHVAAVVRIAFGIIWVIDATFKWLPGFVHGQTLGDELGKADTVHTPVIHQWLALWNSVGTAHPQVFAVGTGIVESLIALGILFGAFSRLALIGSAVFSFGIWSGAEAFHLPWTKPGMTDLGPSAAYWIASLGLLLAAAGATWSVDGWLRTRVGPLHILTSPTPESLGA